MFNLNGDVVVNQPLGDVCSDQHYKRVQLPGAPGQTHGLPKTKKNSKGTKKCFTDRELSSNKFKRGAFGVLLGESWWQI